MLAIGTTGHLIEEVLARRLEGAFVAGPVKRDEIIETQIFTEEMVLVTAAKFRSFYEALRSQQGVNILVLRAGCSYRSRLERLLNEAGVSSFGQFEFGTIDGIFGCAREGLGITMMPRSVSERASQNGKLGIHPLPRRQALVPTMFIRRKDAVVSAALSRFVECRSHARVPQPLEHVRNERPKGKRNCLRSLDAVRFSMCSVLIHPIWMRRWRDRTSWSYRKLQWLEDC